MKITLYMKSGNTITQRFVKHYKYSLNESSQTLDLEPTWFVEVLDSMGLYGYIGRRGIDLDQVEAIKIN